MKKNVALAKICYKIHTLGCPKGSFRFINEIIGAQHFVFYIISWIYV